MHTPVCSWRGETEPEHPPSHNQVWAPKLCWQLKNLYDKGLLTKTINNLCCLHLLLAVPICICREVLRVLCWQKFSSIHQWLLKISYFTGLPHKDQWNSIEQSFSVISNPYLLLRKIPEPLLQLSPRSFNYSQLSMFAYYFDFPFFWWLACLCREDVCVSMSLLPLQTSFWFSELTLKYRGKMRLSNLCSLLYMLSWT